MHVSKNNFSVYQECGRIMVSVKKNKIAMVCNYCQNTFTQLTGFMRHLKHQHNDKLKFANQNQEVEIYAIEELLNKTDVSLSSDISSDDHSLTEDDFNWLNKGVEPTATTENGIKTDSMDKDDLGLFNMSISKALEDGDIFFNLKDNAKSNHLRKSDKDEKENNSNILLKEIINDWQDSDSNEVVLKRTDCSDIEQLNFFKNMDITKESQAKPNMKEMSQGKDIINLLQNLDDLDDIDSLLENLETNTFKEVLEEHIDNLNDGKTVESNSEFKSINKSIQNLQNDNCSKNELLFNSKRISTLLRNNQNIVLNVDKNKLKDTSLTQIKNELDDITSNVGNDVASIVSYIEDSLCDNHIEVSGQETFNANVSGLPAVEFKNDFESPLKDLEKSANAAKSVEKVGIENLKVKNTKIDGNINLNEDLTKALADALEDDMDFDLLNMQAVENCNELLNQELQNLLDMELFDTESENIIQSVQKQPIIKATKVLEESISDKNSNNQTKSFIYQNNIKSKYQKTNLKAKNKPIENHSQNSSNLGKTMELKICTPNYMNLKESKLTAFKENYIFSQQQQLTLKSNVNKSPDKTFAIINNSKVLTELPQRMSPLKENNSSALNNGTIKKEKLIPVSNFISTDIGDTTPLRKKDIILDQSLKPYEKQENLCYLTLNCGKEIEKKQSSNPQKEQGNLKYQHTLPATKQIIPQKQITPQIINKSPKIQENLNQISHKNKTFKTPEKFDTSLQIKNKDLSKSSEIPLKNVCSSPKKNTHYIHCRTPLTTPQRLRNVAIKLQRLTPDKLVNAIKYKTISPQKNKSTTDGSYEISEHFKLPMDIHVRNIDKANSNPSEIDETPVKTTSYLKQNFSESSFKSITPEKHIKESPSLTECLSLIQPYNKNNNDLKQDVSFLQHRARKASIDIVPSSSTALIKQQNYIPTANKTPRHSNLDYKSYAVNRSARKKEFLQRMRRIKKQIFNENGECITKVDHLKPSSIQQPKKSNVFIENVQILPDLKNFKMPLAINTVTTIPSDDGQKQTKISTPIIDVKKIKKSLKRPASSSPLNNEKQAKRLHKSPSKEGQQVAELEATHLGLSESVVEFLQRDLVKNRLNVDSFLEEEMTLDHCTSTKKYTESNAKDDKLITKTGDSDHSNNSIVFDLLEQMNNERNTNKKSQGGSTTNSAKEQNITIIDFNEYNDITLLDRFGLKVIKSPDYEEFITMEERDKMNEKAVKFSKICKNFPNIWSSKNSESPTFKQELQKSFKLLLIDTNLLFNLDLNLTELKHLVNLINIWFAHNLNGKPIEKRKISGSTNRYLYMFNFLPKNGKRFYYCEYCEEYFNTEHKYFTHRILHTGDLYPYTCRKCSIGYKTAKQFKSHELSCNIEKSNLYSANLHLNTNEKSDNHAYKCLVCKEAFPTSVQLYEHSKKHLKTIYNCAKCELVFAADIDVKNHMSICNTVPKLIPKQCTPRPLKKPTAYSRN